MPLLLRNVCAALPSSIQSSQSDKGLVS
ncbi:hypothetical protein EYZ11_007768 [Aspergillus tanneri]|uniref:Uncharacterized protein n=1 Tax=Aspergillus tanneri TaxID=1220188 RepID=A0A4S3JCC9_9EURO|nr:hypothetical protein EYZ11_007768 [Aspergillus tanneri]